MITKQRFIKGMVRDSNPLDLDNQSYTYMENGDIVNNDGESFDAISNLRGNKELHIELGGDESLFKHVSPFGSEHTEWKIVGAVNVRDDIVLFYANNEGTESRIDLLKYDTAINHLDNRYYRIQLVDLNLGFSQDKIIHAIGNYEAPDKIKVYFGEKFVTNSDINTIRQLNIAQDFTDGIGAPVYEQSSYTRVNGLLEQDLEMMALSYNADLSRLTFDSGNLRIGNGVLRNGTYQYSCRYIDDVGRKTMWSELSPIISITDSVKNQTTGTEGEMNSGKSIEFDISIAFNHNYDNIEIARLWKSSINSTPEVLIIDRIGIKGATTISVIDSYYGSTFGFVDYNEFNIQANFFKAKTMVVKDNRLFIGNIEEDFFDTEYDARIYRFNSSRISDIYKADGTTLVESLNGALVNWKDTAELIPIDSDIHNKFNDISLDTIGTNAYKYQADGTTLGAQGVNVSVSFDTSYDYNNNDFKLGVIKGFMYDEIYSFGIVLFDKYGRQSPVKYIGDIRMPKYRDIYPSFTYKREYDLCVPYFNVSNLPGEVNNYQIVRVERTVKDRTILTQGVLSSLEDKGTHFQHGWYEPQSPTFESSELFRLHSPEISFFKDLNLKDTYIEQLNDVSYDYLEYGHDIDAFDSGSACFYYSDLKVSGSALFPFRNKIKDFAIAQQKDTVYVDGNTIVPIGTGLDTLGAPVIYYNSTASIIALDTSILAIGKRTLIVNIRRYIIPYGAGSYNKRLNSVYVPASIVYTGNGTVGCRYGDTFVNRYKYFHATWIHIPELEAEYPGGVIDPNNPASLKIYSAAHIIDTIVESSINLKLRHDDFYSIGNSNIDAIQVQEEGLTLTDSRVLKLGDGRETQHNAIVDISPTYLYNSVYSSINKTKLAIQLPADRLKNYVADTMIRYSEKKISGELYDSWLDFKANNYSTLDANYGSLNYMVRLNDNVFVFQDNAVVALSISPTVQTTTDSGLPVVLGKGDIIHSHQYLSTNVGIQKCNEAVVSVSFIYWIDLNRKKLYRFGEGIQSISDIKGVSSYFKQTLNKNTRFLGVYDNSRTCVMLSIVNDSIGVKYDDNTFTVSVGFEFTYLTGDTTNVIMETGLIYKLNTSSGKEGTYRLTGIYETNLEFEYLYGDEFINADKVYMHKFIDLKNNYTMVFNEPLNLFIGFETFIPDLYLKTPKGFMTSNNANLLYEHNLGEYGEYYGITYPLMFEYVLNPQSSNAYYEAIELINELTTGERKLEGKSNYIGIENRTITEIRGITNTQQSEYIDLFVKNSTAMTETELNTSTGEYEATDNQSFLNYAGSSRVIADTNGVKTDTVYPAYLYNISKDLNQFKTAVPRNKTGLTYTDEGYSKAINELLNGNYCKIRVLYDNSMIGGRFKILDIMTHFEPYTL